MSLTQSLSAIACLALVGCASNPAMVWVNPKLPNNDEGIRQELADKLLCGRVAAGEAPPPAAREFMPVPSGGYTFTGQATTYGNAGLYNSQISGVATPQGGFSSGFATGYNIGLAMQKAAERSRWEEAYANCMQKLGWTKVPASEAGTTSGDGTKSGDGTFYRSLKTPLGGRCDYSGDCQGTAICQANLCTAKP